MINLYIGNHGKKDGIKDYIDILSHIFKSRGIDLEVSEKLCGSGVNIVIDEFTNIISNKRIASLKKSTGSARFVYVLTEFIEKQFMVKSFNHFGGIRDSAILAFINLYLRWKRKDFKRARFKEYLVFFLLSPVLTLYAPASILYGFVLNIYHYLRGTPGLSILRLINPRLHQLIYTHLRYLGFEAMIGYADGVVLSHAAIRQGYDEFRNAGGDGPNPMGVLYPEFSPIDLFQNHLDGKKLYVEITGSITRYRGRFARKINECIMLLGLRHWFGTTQCYPFDEIFKMKPNERGAFSLHPPQSARWPYSSPTRIYRALCVDKNIPILTKKFNQHPIEDLCLVYEGEETILTMHELYTNKLALTEYIKTKVAQYMRLAKEANDNLCVAVLALVQDAK